jgi:hypothetical protein
MSKPVMTPKDVEALEAARREFKTSVEVFDRAIQDHKPISEIDDALRTMQQKQAEYRTLAERFTVYVTDSPS